jgi:hypothetical protein
MTVTFETYKSFDVFKVDIISGFSCINNACVNLTQLPSVFVVIQPSLLFDVLVY